jgi:hypothetical protein
MKKKLGTYTGLLVVLVLLLTLTPADVSALMGTDCVICNFDRHCERGPFCAEHAQCEGNGEICWSWNPCEIW